MVYEESAIEKKQTNNDPYGGLFEIRMLYDMRGKLELGSYLL